MVPAGGASTHSQPRVDQFPRFFVTGRGSIMVLAFVVPRLIPQMDSPHAESMLLCRVLNGVFLRVLGFHALLRVEERQEAVAASSSIILRNPSSAPIGKTPEAATVWPSPNPPIFSQESGSILESGGRVPLSIILARGCGARPETLTKVDGSLPHPGTSGGTFIIPIRYLTGLTSPW